jgi:mono/diheme cytochrome c family protein
MIRTVLAVSRRGSGWMLRKLMVLLAIVVAIGVAVFWGLTTPAMVAASALPEHCPDLDNGRTMFYAGGCSGCHAVPKQDDRTRLGGGVALPSAFGTFYAPNISSDPNAGIGSWSEAQFVTAMVAGTSPQDTHYYPSFPYTSFHIMRIEDIRDLFAFLKTLPADNARSRAHDLKFPFTLRRGLGLWKLLFLDRASPKPDPSKSAAWNRGAYLVNGPGHCAECHSPRNFLGGIIASQRFAGAPNPVGKGWVPNITQRDLKDWSERDIAYLLESGQTPEGDSVGSSMAEIVRSTSQLPADDRAAIAAYIKSLPPVEGPKPSGRK